LDRAVDLLVAVDGLDDVLGRAAAIRKPRHRRAHHPFRVREELVHGCGDLLQAAARTEFVQPTLGETMGGELRSEGASSLLGRSPLRPWGWRAARTNRSSTSWVRGWGGRITPSSSSGREKAGRLAGSIPPTSAWWARETA